MPQAGQALPAAGPLGPVAQTARPWGQVVSGDECLRGGREMSGGLLMGLPSHRPLGKGAGDCESIPMKSIDHSPGMGEGLPKYPGTTCTVLFGPHGLHPSFPHLYPRARRWPSLTCLFPHPRPRGLRQLLCFLEASVTPFCSPAWPHCGPVSCLL